MPNQIKATNNFVFIIRDEEKKEQGGLLLPTAAKVKPHEGTVISVGGLVRDQNIKASKGRKVLFHQTVGFAISYDNVDYWVLMDSEIIAVV